MGVGFYILTPNLTKKINNMAKRVEEQLSQVDYKEQDFTIDEDAIKEQPAIKIEVPQKEVSYKSEAKQYRDKPKDFVSCLRKERIIVRHIPKQTGMITQPKHILYGGMAENAIRTFTVPRLLSGAYVNVLTDSEKDFLEEVMGLEYNALSVYRKQDNYWENKTVRLRKQDNFFDLSDPDDYIKYKILLANKDFIAPSMQAYEDLPKITYQFVILRENEEIKTAEKSMSATMMAYKEFGKIENDEHTLRTLIEMLDGRPVSVKTKLEFLKTKVNELIQANSKTFLKAITDPMLSTKVLIKRAIEEGIISSRGGMLYLKSDNTPLCEDGEDPTLSIASKYLNQPKRQELKFMIESKLK